MSLFGCLGKRLSERPVPPRCLEKPDGHLWRKRRKSCAFPLEVVKAVAAAVGERMGMADPVPTFSHIVSELKRLRPTLAYIHVIEPRISADSSVDASPQNAGQSDDFIRDIWGDRPLISGGGFTRDSGIKLAEERKNSLVAHGRHFIANPDLPVRLQKNIPLHPYDRSTFYLPGLGAPTGYTDQPFASSATPAA
ncbi:hypothetical protein DFH08DRAFT_807215 [Mycena albidolilacea]|uniref:NADH:flavin oxidoreductase/NADH oxidase N-terminal domain-containing protein n=1 Tax=Mycena albidolilacea TaxID=1033008 RepID=A0AAD7A6D4_9AGAR|nr:hypothetical protein DFH08DRAFT_807215 [Mycena albidolilacea]